MSVRLERLNHLLRDDLSQLIRSELKDPRLKGLLTVTHVETAPDLSAARVLVSIMAPPEERAQALKGLVSARGFLRHLLGARIKIRRIPELRFVLDTSIQRGSEVIQILDKLAAEAPAEERP